MSEENFIQSAVQEMEEEFGYSTSVIDKHAFDISINPASVVGSIAGSMLGTSIAKKHQLKKSVGAVNAPLVNLGSNYYDEVKTVAQNLQVLFTPLSVLYILSMNNRQITLDTINTEEMDNEMYDAWRRRDQLYFKNLMLNKMHTELQLVEQMFARRMLDKKMQIQSAIEKKAMEETANDNDDVGIFDIVDGVCQIKALSEKTAGSKLVDMIVESFDQDTQYMVSWELERPIAKYAGVLSGALNFFGLDNSANNLKAMQKKYLDPRYLSNRLKVSFLPDRVLFLVDNMLITQIPVIKLNDTGMERFQKQDAKYFKNMFEEASSKGLADVQIINIQKAQRQAEKIQKQASRKPIISDIFTEHDIHPMIYLLALDSHYGQTWVDMDPEVIISSIENDFGLKDSGIDDIVLNKILTIQALNKSPLPFENALMFEKTVRALNNKPIDFDAWQPDNSAGELMFALQVMDDLTPTDNIFDNFSEDVVDYLVTVLVNKDCRVIDLENKIINSDLEKKFFETLNNDLTKAWNMRVIDDANDDEDVDKHIKRNELIAHVVKVIVRSLRQNHIMTSDGISSFIAKVAQRSGFDESITNALKQDVRRNISIDIMLEEMSMALEEQKKLYNL